MKKAICIVAQDNDLSPFYEEYDKLFNNFSEKEDQAISHLENIRKEYENQKKVKWERIENIIKERGIQYDNSTQFLEIDNGVLFVCDDRDEALKKEEESRLVKHIFNVLQGMDKK
jgi:hypothetical protein